MARSLVEALERRRAQYETLGKVPGGPEWIAASFRAGEEALRQVSKLAEPYAARMAALERVADCALAVVNLPLAMREALDDLRRALAAVPEIPEES